MQPWHGEIETSPALVRALVRTQFPALAADRVEPFGSGWDNTAFLVGDNIVFRFPRKQSAVELLETEPPVLRRLAPLVPLQIPVPAWIGTPSDAFPWPFLGYLRLSGRTACKAGPSNSDRHAAAPLPGERLVLEE
ncbi:MAG: phosphotransferase [Longimicrobiales bacterium]